MADTCVCGHRREDHAGGVTLCALDYDEFCRCQAYTAPLGGAR